MEEKVKKPDSGLLKIVLIPIIIGIIGSLMTIFGPLFIIDVILREFWGPVLQYNSSFFMFSPWDQKLYVFLAGNILIGLLLIRFMGRHVRDRNEATLQGMLTGSITGLTVSGRVFIDYSKEMQSGFYTAFSSEFPKLCFLMILTSIFIQAIILRFWFNHSREDPSPSKASLMGISVGKISLIVILVIVSILVLPPVYAYYQIQTGTVKIGPNPFPGKADWIIPTRLSRSSISIIQEQASYRPLGPLPSWLPQRVSVSKPPFFQILVDGRDMSNQSVVSQNAYYVTIDPPEGLVYRFDSEMRITGPDIGSRVNLTITEIFEDGRHVSNQWQI